MKLLNRIKKYFAIKSYSKKLPPILKKRYGKHKHYSKPQIKSSIEYCGLSEDYTDYAYAMHMSRKKYNEMREIKNDSDDFDLLRKEIADSCFDGNSNFTIHDALDFAAKSGSIFSTESNFDNGISDSDTAED